MRYPACRGPQRRPLASRACWTVCLCLCLCVACTAASVGATSPSPAPPAAPAATTTAAATTVSPADAVHGLGALAAAAPIPLHRPASALPVHVAGPQQAASPDCAPRRGRGGAGRGGHSASTSPASSVGTTGATGTSPALSAYPTPVVSHVGGGGAAPAPSVDSPATYPTPLGAMPTSAEAVIGKVAHGSRAQVVAGVGRKLPMTIAAYVPAAVAGVASAAVPVPVPVPVLVATPLMCCATCDHQVCRVCSRHECRHRQCPSDAACVMQTAGWLRRCGQRLVMAALCYRRACQGWWEEHPTRSGVLGCVGERNCVGEGRVCVCVWERESRTQSVGRWWPVRGAEGLLWKHPSAAVTMPSKGRTCRSSNSLKTLRELYDVFCWPRHAVLLSLRCLG